MVNLLQVALWALGTLVVCVVGGTVVLAWLMSLDGRR